MRLETLPWLKCPKKSCSGSVDLSETGVRSRDLSSDLRPSSGKSSLTEIEAGTLICKKCRAKFPIVSGVAILVEDQETYWIEHVKGISRWVPHSDIPKAFRSLVKEALAHVIEEQEAGNLEDDLESERVVSLYLLNHFIRAGDQIQGQPWYQPTGKLLENLVRDYWDQGPMDRIMEWVRGASVSGGSSGGSWLEVGCGVGGMGLRMAPFVENFLGFDHSFASIALARHWVLGEQKSDVIRYPGDLLNGAVSKDAAETFNRGAWRKELQAAFANTDFVVGDFHSAPVRDGSFDGTLALNTIDMMEDPVSLPKFQAHWSKPGGWFAQSDPYIWHDRISKKIQKVLPKKATAWTSEEAVNWMVGRAGGKILHHESHLPWIFFKNQRQIEVYWVHAFFGQFGVLKK